MNFMVYMLKLNINQHQGSHQIFTYKADNTSKMVLVYNSQVYPVMIYGLVDLVMDLICLIVMSMEPIFLFIVNSKLINWIEYTFMYGL